MRNLVLFVLVVFCSCGPKKIDTEATDADTVQASGSDQKPRSVDTILSLRGSAEFDDRFSIAGDFNGDGATDTVYESLVSQLTNLEMAKEFDAENWDRNVELIINHEPLTRLYSSIVAVDTFMVTGRAQQIGVSFFSNLGDLDSEPGDEFGYAVKWADMSNMNTYHIVTLKDNRFTEVFNFKINEFVSFETENLFDNGQLVKPVSSKLIAYKFYSDSATVEQAVYAFQ